MQKLRHGEVLRTALPMEEAELAECLQATHQQQQQQQVAVAMLLHNSLCENGVSEKLNRLASLWMSPWRARASC